MADDGVRSQFELDEGMRKLTVDDEAELSLDFGKKKKKKPKKDIVLDEEGQDTLAEPKDNNSSHNAEDEPPQSPALAPADAPAAGTEEALELDLDLDLNLKKKKKKKKARKEDLEELDAEAGEEGLLGEGVEVADDTAKDGGRFPWSGTDRDYTHDELLERVYGILREKNPELSGGPRRTVLKPPQVAREGTKKTVFTNFMDLCKAMNRQNEHVSAYLLAELGTSGSLDGQQRLIVKGRFLPKSFETVLRRYVNEYVLCPGCKSVDTLLDRDSATRLMHLRCQQCGASRTVQPIKSGFVARVTRRQQV